MITFYILHTNSSTPIKDHIIFACNIVEQEYNKGNRIHIHVSTQKEAQDIDDILWTFKDISFVPHTIYIKNLDNFIPQVTIGYNNFFGNYNDIVLNLTTNIFTDFLKFKHIIEIIPNNEESRIIARGRFRKYRESINNIQVIDVS